MMFDKPILMPMSPLPSELKLLDWVEIPLSHGRVCLKSHVSL